MAAKESVCSDSVHNDPNFAVICSFVNRYGELLGLPDISFEDLEKWIADTRYVNSNLLDILMKLLRRWRSSVHKDKWEKTLSKFCCTYSQVDAWEIEEFGFPRCKIATKLRIIKNLVEKQFDCNSKFKDKINDKVADELRFTPIGRDSTGVAYWYLLDNDFNVRVYKEEQDDVEAETWQVVVRDRTELVDLITRLTGAPSQETVSSTSTSPATVKDTDEDVDAAAACGEVKDVSLVKPEIKEEKPAVSNETDQKNVSPLCSIKEEPDEVTEDSDVSQTHVIKKEEEDNKTRFTGADVRDLSSKTLVVKVEKIADATLAESTGSRLNEVSSEAKPIVIESTEDETQSQEDTETEGATATEASTEPSSPCVIQVTESEQSDFCDEGVKESSSIASGELCCPDGGEKTAVEETARTTDLISISSQEETTSCDIKRSNEASLEVKDGSTGHSEVTEPQVQGASSQNEENSHDSQNVSLINEEDKNETEQNEEEDQGEEVKVKKRKIIRLSKIPDVSSPENDNAEEKCRKRKRGSALSPPPVTSPASQPESDASPEESELSDTSLGDNLSSQGDEPPSKKKRERCRLTMSQRNQKKCLNEEAEDSIELKQKDQNDDLAAEEPDSEQKDNQDLALKSQLSEDKQSGSDKENKRRLGKENWEESDEPTSKKGRKATSSRRGRGRGKGRSSRMIDSRVGVETDDEDDVPLIQLRRSSRSTKGQRVITPLFTESPSRRKSKKDKEREEKEQKKKEKQERKRQRELARQEKSAAKSKKKKRGMSDEEFVPGRKGRRKHNSDSSDSVSDEEEEDLFDEAERDESLHWSTSHSEAEAESEGSEYIPTGRNAKRAAQLKAKQLESSENGSNCTKCNKGNHPEWILLCDKCDAGYHTACLRPPIMLIPHGDWFCPTCEHHLLVEKLQQELTELDSQMKKKDALVRRKERLAYVGISVTNILMDEKERKTVINAESEEESEVETKRARRQNQRNRRRANRYAGQYGSIWDESDSDEIHSDSSSSSSGASSLSSSSSSEPMVAARSRRQRKDISYKFEEYDKMISTALEDDKKDPAYIRSPPIRPAVSRGKDMSNITGMKEVLEAEERALREAEEVSDQNEEEKKITSKPGPMSRKSRKQRRRLTELDSDQDLDDSDEYKATDDESVGSVDEDYEEENIEEELSDDWRVGSRHKKTQRSRTKRGPVRRSARNSRRIFLDDSEEEASLSDQSYKSDLESPRKAKSKSRLSRKTFFESDESEPEKPRRRKRRSSSRYEDDSDYVPSDSKERSTRKSRRASSGVKYHESGTDSDYKPSKKSKGKVDLQAFIKSSGESDTDNYYEDNEEEIPVKTKKTKVKVASRNFIDDDDDDDNSDNYLGECDESKTKSATDSNVDYKSSNAAGFLKGKTSQCNGEFGANDILKDSEQHGSDGDDNDNGDDDDHDGSLEESDAQLSGVEDLSDVEDLVNLITQS